MYKVTSITAIYKGGSFIEGFMEDIVQQTAFEDCEWFLVDGDSPDNEHEIIKPYLSKHSNIRYERLSPDPGLYASWNYMVENSDSDYITNANLDDRLFPECIEKHIQALDNNPESDVAYCENILSFVENDSFKNYRPETPVELFPEGGGPFYKPNMIGHNYPHNHPMWRRSLHDRFGHFDTKYISASDYEFWMRCLHAGVNDFTYIPEVLGIYYRNPTGVSSKPDVDGVRVQQEMEIKLKYAKHFAGQSAEDTIVNLVKRLCTSGRITEDMMRELGVTL